MANKEKRKKFELTIDQKYLIIGHHQAHPKMKQTELIAHFNKEFSTVIKKLF